MPDIITLQWQDTTPHIFNKTHSKTTYTDSIANNKVCSNLGSTATHGQNQNNEISGNHPGLPLEVILENEGMDVATLTDYPDGDVKIDHTITPQYTIKQIGYVGWAMYVCWYNSHGTIRTN